MFDFQAEVRAALQSVWPELDAVVRRAVREEVPAATHGDPDELLDAEQAAKLVGMTPAALRRAAERGTFPVDALRIGRRLRWRRGDLVALRRQHGARRSARMSGNGAAESLR